MAVIEAVTVQFSHPDDDDEIARTLREDGLTPLLVNGLYVASTTEDQLQKALDLTKERLVDEPEDDTTAYRRSVVEAMALAMESGEDEALDELPNDALLLLAEGLIINGYDDADQLPFCAIQFKRDDVNAPIFATRPDEPPAGST